MIGVLTDQPTPRSTSNYWAKVNEGLKVEGAPQPLINCQQLKMTATDGKKRMTDVADTEQLLRMIQSVPSPKAEPFKRANETRIIDDSALVCVQKNLEQLWETAKEILSVLAEIQ